MIYLICFTAFCIILYTIRAVYLYKKKRLYVFNPYLKYPRNESCYCGSGLKFKKCCLPNEDGYVILKKAKDLETVNKIKALIKKVRK